MYRRLRRRDGSATTSHPPYRMKNVAIKDRLIYSPSATPTAGGRTPSTNKSVGVPRKTSVPVHGFIRERPRPETKKQGRPAGPSYDVNPNFEDIENVFGGSAPSLSPKHPLVDQWVEFKSPVLGSCTGQVVMTEGDRLLVDHHSILRNLAFIQTKWVQKTIPQPPEPQ